MKNIDFLTPFRSSALENKIAGIQGDNHNGIFKIPVFGRVYFVVASDGGGWDHVSVSPEKGNRCPSWQVMAHIKSLFFGENECVIQYHPPVQKYVNTYESCLHLWRPQVDRIPMPPTFFV